MNEKLLEYLPDPETLKGGIQELVDIVQREAPLVVEEIMRWGFVRSMIVFIAGAAVMSLYWVNRKRLGLWLENSVDECDRAGYFVGYWLVMLACNFIGSVIMLGSLSWLKIWLAPRLFLLEYISDLM